MPLSIQSLFSYVPLTEMVTKVMGGVPKILPDAFFTTTREIPGDRLRRATFRGTRQLAKISKYGSPPRNVARVGRGQQDIVMLHSIEQIQASHELLMLLRRFDDYLVQNMCRDLLEADAIEFGNRMSNLDITAVQASLAFGKIWVDVDGTLLTSSSGADLEIDYGVPAANIGDVGGIIGTVWSDAAADIVGDILAIKSMVRQKTGRELVHAFCGANVAGYLAKNTVFKEYLVRNGAFNESYVKSGHVQPGVLGLQWLNVQDMFFGDANEAATSYFPADQITFYPEITKDVYENLRGGYPVPKSFSTGIDLNSIASQMEYVYGPFKYAYQMPGHMQINMAQGITFLPDHKVPEAIVIADTCP